MSKINAFRVINLNYNNNSIRINDETFFLNGESTLISLRNGGGKSVLIQMITALFVNKKARDTKERSFSSYFTTNKPTFLLVEWLLDHGGGYALTGMMVRRKQTKSEEEEKEDLDILYFVTEYQKPNRLDISHFPVIEEKDGKKSLKSFGAVSQLLEGWKNDKTKKFFVYDMTIPFQARGYFNKIEEYQIFRKEWESIIKKVNQRESGLSELFADAKDEKGLVEKWFLEAVEDKLNREENKIKNFAENTRKFILQYQENKSKIEKKERIIIFQEDMKESEEAVQALLTYKEERKRTEEKIGKFYFRIEELKQGKEKQQIELQNQIQTIKAELYNLHYDEICYEIYQLKEEQSKKEKEEIDLKQNLALNQAHRQEAEKKKNILECAKIYKEYKEQEKEVNLYKNQWNITQEKEKELQPEREQLGYNLRHYYEKKRAEEQENIEKIESRLLTNKNMGKELEDRIEKNQKSQREIASELGAAQEGIKGYEEAESEFQNRYQYQLSRNILGEYAPGFFEIEEQKQQQLLQNREKECNENKKEKALQKEKQKKLTREMEDIKIEQGTLSANLDNVKRQAAEYEEQLLIRKTIIEHIHFSEQKIFHTAEILEAFEKRIKEIERQTRNLYQKKEDKEREYKKLEEGKVLELPKEMEEALAEQEISFIFGMEWLKKNGKSSEENMKLVEENPFLPYGIIMEEQDIRKLQRKNLGVYTSFPIPILHRQGLYDSQGKAGNIIETEQVNFYILFNDKLLNEQELKKILEKKQIQLEELEEEIQRKEEEASFFRGKRELILAQNISKECCQNCEKKQKDIEDKILLLTEKEKEMRAVKQQIEERLLKLEQEISQMEKEIGRQKEQTADFSRLRIKYIEYLEKINRKNELEKTKDSLIQAIQKNRNMMIRQKEEEEELRQEKQDKIFRVQEIAKKEKQYQVFRNAPLLEKTIEEIEARFIAITSNISLEEKQIEELLKKASEKLESIKKELLYRTERAKLNEMDYKNTSYDHFRLEEIEREIEYNRKEKDRINEEEKELTKEITRLTEKLHARQERLKQELGTEKLRPKENIIFVNFKAQIAQKKEVIKKKEEDINCVQVRINCYQEVLFSMEDYKYLKLEGEIDSEKQTEKMEKLELLQFRSELLKENMELQKREQEKREELEFVLQNISIKPQFQEDFFARPLEILRTLTKSPENFLEQLQMILHSYQQLLEKLLIDIEFLEKEKRNIMEQYLEYIQDIHRNLGEIDKNSTIKVREKPVKMLRIMLSDWKEKESLYKENMNTYFEELLQTAIKRLSKNENIEEMLGTQITTKKLYDAVVGIRNAEIKLYKIEEARERQIDWKDVGKNSGGEGFLSAFIVLSSLLSFMRREDTDIFQGKEQGKVLLMDNPFAQTNASHLLIPLMETARKNNTQLICLSGLGGESIYNRFDNIYILTLAASAVRKGVEFVKSEHLKGEEVQELMTSWIRIDDIENEKEPEQIQLFQEKKTKGKDRKDREK